MPWTIGAFPEFDHLEPPQRAALLRGLPWWTYPGILLASVIPAALLALVASVLIGRGLPSGGRPALFLLATVLLGLCFYQYELRRLRGLIRKEVGKLCRDTKPPFCLTCGYDLRESAGSRCPECGAATIARG